MDDDDNDRNMITMKRVKNTTFLLRKEEESIANLWRDVVLLFSLLLLYIVETTLNAASFAFILLCLIVFAFLLIDNWAL